MVIGHVGVQLPLDSLLDQFSKGRDNRDGSIVGWIGGIAGFVDGMNDRVFPGSGKFTRCETGVDDLEKDMTNGAKTELKNPDADTIRTTGC